MKRIIPVLIGTCFLFLLYSNFVDASSQSSTSLLKSKYPNEIIQSIKTVDLNNDKKDESIILTKSGNLFFVNSKGVLVLINTNILSDEDYDPPKIQVFSVSKTEKHVAVTYNYFPSNTQLFVYQLKDGTLLSRLKLMGDQGVEIDVKGRIHQYWKKYRNEGGWDLAEGLFTWNTKLNKYMASGKYVLQ
ncbi:hypothetical protein D3C81_1092790 [compost metagenome]